MGGKRREGCIGGRCGVSIQYCSSNEWSNFDSITWLQYSSSATVGVLCRCRSLLNMICVLSGSCVNFDEDRGGILINRDLRSLDESVG